VQANTPEDARFFINTTHWLGGNYRGVDGGGWLLPYTGRWSLIPTVFYSFSPDRVYIQQIQDWGKRASEINTCSADFLALVEEAGLEYVYLREGIGSLQKKGLQGCEDIIPIYSNKNVNVYSLTR
jgi:hypothetical protein